MKEIIGYLHEYHFWYKLPLLVGGVMFLFTGLLYETEEGEIQNRLEEWWCKLDDAANSSLNINFRIIQGFAKRSQAHIELLFGKNLISAQSVGVSICWGMISAKLTIIILGLSSGAPPTVIIIGELVTILFFWYLSKRPIVLPPSRHSQWLRSVIGFWVIFIFAAYLSGTLGNKINGPPPMPEAGNERIVRLGIAKIPLYTLGVVFSIPISIIFIAISRRSLRYIIQSKSNGSMINATLLHVIFLSILISLHLFAIQTLKSQSDFREYMFQMITPIMSYAYWMTIFFVLLVVHIVFWGIMRRPIYALQRIGGERRKKLFVGIGGILFILAFPKLGEVLKSWLDVIKSIF
jgi:hypothetical protein